jgi:hypothetical protein
MNLSPSSNQELAVPINLHESRCQLLVGIDGNRTLGFRPDRLPEPGRHVPGAQFHGSPAENPLDGGRADTSLGVDIHPQ